MRAFRRTVYGLATAAILGLLGCAAPAEEQTAEDEAAYAQRPWSEIFRSSLIEPATKGPIRVRLVVTVISTKPWERWIEQGVGRWLAPLRSLPGGERLGRNAVVFVDKDEDLTVNILPGRGRGLYVPGGAFGQQHIDLNEESGDLMRILHELGHAFGLDDTYVEGKWTCAADQPESVMCNAATYELRADDIRGVKNQYCRRTRRCNADQWRDTFGGGGGHPFRATCAANERVVALQVRAGSVVDSVAPICEHTRSQARRMLPSVGSALGREWGDVYAQLACPAGTYVTAVRIQSGNLVDNLQLRCSDGSYTDDVGGSGGSSHWYRCPSEYPAVVGLRGGAGNSIDRLGLSCDVDSGARFSTRRGPLPD